VEEIESPNENIVALLQFVNDKIKVLEDGRGVALITSATLLGLIAILAEDDHKALRDLNFKVAELAIEGMNRTLQNAFKVMRKQAEEIDKECSMESTKESEF